VKPSGAVMVVEVKAADGGRRSAGMARLAISLPHTSHIRSPFTLRRAAAAAVAVDDESVSLQMDHAAIIVTHTLLAVR